MCFVDHLSAAAVVMLGPSQRTKRAEIRVPEGDENQDKRRNAANKKSLEGRQE